MDILVICAWYSLVLVLILMIPHIVGPIAIHRKMTIQADPDLVPFPPDHPGLPEEVEDHYQRVTELLTRAGFEVVQGIALPEHVRKVKTLVLLFANRTTKDIAMATAIFAETPQGTKLKTAYVEIGARFRDGSLVLTSNSAALGAFRKRPNATATQFPTVRTADRLFRLHAALVEKHRGGEKFLRLDEEFRGDALATLAKGMREELEAQVDAGYLYLSEREGVFRPTWKGAFIMTWNLLYPFKQIRLAIRDRKARRLIAELEGTKSNGEEMNA